MRNGSHLMHRTASCTVLAIIMALALSSCSGGSLEATVEQMRQEACEGDVEGFFSYIDTDAVARDYNWQVADRKIQANEDLNLILKLIVYTNALLNIYDIIPLYDGTYATPSTAEFLDRLLWKYFKADIKKGEQSELCSIEIDGSDTRNGNITFSFKDEDYIWKFKKADKSWKLVSVNYDEIHLSRNETYPKHDQEAVNTESGKEVTITEAEELQGPALEQGGQPYDFRKTRWGMSLSEVKSSEDADYVGVGTVGMDDEEYDSALVYEDKIGGLDVIILYIFTNEKLSQAIYQFKSRYSDPDTYLVNFNKMVEAYKNKYGAPWEVKEEWKNEKYKNDPDKVGQALSEGHINYATTWQTLETEITVGLNKGEDISLYVYYLSKHYDEKYERLKREREAEKKEEKTEKKIGAKEIEEKL